MQNVLIHPHPPTEYNNHYFLRTWPAYKEYKNAENAGFNNISKV